MKINNKRRLLPLITAAAAMTVAAAFSQAAWAAEEDIILLYTNDVHCGIDGSIGYAGLALYKQQMEAQTPHVTLIDAGDAIQGAPIGTLSDGGNLIDIMNYVGYDFAIPGNHEFDYGMPRFLELSEQLECGYYSCNFMDLRTGKSVFEPYKMEDYGDVQVAFVGITTPESFPKSTPVYFQDGDGSYIYGFCEGNEGNELYQTVQNTVDQARAEGADYVIAVSHLGEHGVTPYWSSDAVVAATDGIDAVIDGHSHETVPSKTVRNRSGEEVLISQTGTKLSNIGKMTIEPDGTIRSELVSEVPADQSERMYQVVKGDSLARIAKRELGSYDRWMEVYERNRGVVSDPDRILPGMVLTIPSGVWMNGNGKHVDYKTAQFISRIEAEYEESLKTVLGRSNYLLTALDPAGQKRAVRNQETNLGDFCADAFRYVLGADIGLMNGGGIRADIEPGEITYQDLLALSPFGNMACMAEATGQQIKDALEAGSINYPAEDGSFLHVSGLSYQIDSSIPSSVVIDDKGSFVKVDGAYRVTDIMVGDEPLDVSKTYTVASHNYLLKSGGGMSLFQGCEILRDEVMTDVDVFSAYINGNLGGTIGAEYAEPEGQGRIVVK